MNAKPQPLTHSYNMTNIHKRFPLLAHPDISMRDIGIDKIRVTVPIDEHLTVPESRIWASNSSKQFYRSRMEVGDGISAQLFINRGSSSLDIELNPSSKKTLKLGTVSDTFLLLKEVLTKLDNSIIVSWSFNYKTGVHNHGRLPQNWLNRTKIKRLDIAVDVTYKGEQFLESLFRISPKRNRKIVAYVQKSEVETIEVRYSKSMGKVMVYNKTKENPRYPRGVFRFEIQARKGFLDDHGMCILSGLTEEKIQELFVSRISVANWDKFQVIDSGAYSQLLNSGIPIAACMGLFGYMRIREMGETGRLTKHLDEKYSKMLSAELGKLN